MSNKTAIVLFNLGGPDSLDAVRPFLRNLFADKAILRLPWPVRLALAEIISRSRAAQARKNYARIGGKSPLLRESLQQGEALQNWLHEQRPDEKLKCFVAMRYWQPVIKTVQAQIRRWGAKRIVLLPLYPQFSTTTTGSFFEAWQKTQKYLPEPLKIYSYESDEGFVRAHVKNILGCYEQNGSPKNTRVLFSAHGLPQSIVLAGDPYPQQIEKTCAAIAEQLPAALGETSLGYQSRVGPLEWLGPYTLNEIERAADEQKNLLVVPVAFVSEHVETLVELDIDYRARAQKMGIKHYMRVPALGAAPDFIAALGGQVLRALQG